MNRGSVANGLRSARKSSQDKEVAEASARTRRDVQSRVKLACRQKSRCGCRGKQDGSMKMRSNGNALRPGKTAGVTVPNSDCRIPHVSRFLRRQDPRDIHAAHGYERTPVAWSRPRRTPNVFHDGMVDFLQPSDDRGTEKALSTTEFGSTNAGCYHILTGNATMRNVSAGTPGVSGHGPPDNTMKNHQESRVNGVGEPSRQSFCRRQDAGGDIVGSNRGADTVADGNLPLRSNPDGSPRLDEDDEAQLRIGEAHARRISPIIGGLSYLQVATVQAARKIGSARTYTNQHTQRSHSKIAFGGAQKKQTFVRSPT
ncbi:hypothetical protein DFH07DRAFT_778756 [Mycena maculata]|uniref:Uncharacterized protein n=1 Tax=Mycena maculata TaxID=230809 RepID=A0AAD7MZ65_9AGAR|nr:hypothetical protein DFH07DRAFT_778756 [Mycena maculata]